MILVIQANIFEEGANQPSGFVEFKDDFRKEAETFDGPVVHGHTHTFRIDRPLAGVPNFTRVETFGSPSVHWVRASVDTRDPEVFSFQQEMVEENVVTP